MKILIAPDKFKGSLTADEVCIALKTGLLQYDEKLEIVTCPMADGGDGSISVIENYVDLKERILIVYDPLMRPISASYYYHEDTAYIEMAMTSGLALLNKGERNPLVTTSYGIGQLLLDAVKIGCKRILLFLGGSATHDLGTGLLSALGYKFLDIDDNELLPNGENLSDICTIDDKGLKLDFRSLDIQIVTDVSSPLLGVKGAAYQYAKQKGASESDIEILEVGTMNVSNVLNDFRMRNNDSIIDVNFPGAGAAGGIGYGCMALLNAKIRLGSEYFTLLTDLRSKVAIADLIITGEGKIDDSSVEGKVVSSVCRIANELNKSIIGVCGQLEGTEYNKLNMENVITISEYSKSNEEAIINAYSHLVQIAKLLLD